MTNDVVRAVIELAREVESGDPIDWADLNISEEDAYKLIASSVIENYQKSRNPLIQLAVITKLTVENFVLNLRLLGKEKVQKDDEIDDYY